MIHRKIEKDKRFCDKSTHGIRAIGASLLACCVSGTMAILLLAPHVSLEEYMRGNELEAPFKKSFWEGADRAVVPFLLCLFGFVTWVIWLIINRRYRSVVISFLGPLCSMAFWWLDLDVGGPNAFGIMAHIAIGILAGGAVSIAYYTRDADPAP